MRTINLRTGELDEKMNNLFPMGANISSTKYNLMKKNEEQKNLRKKNADYQNFQVPVQIVIDYSEVLRPTKLRLRSYVMGALGVLANYSKSRVSMH